MPELKTFRVPVPVVIALAVMVLACAETDNYDDSYYYDSGSSCSGTYNCGGSGSGTTPDYTAPAPTTPSRPTLPSYIPELDKSTPPAYPKTADVSIQYGAPSFPADTATQFWDSLLAKYEVNTEGSWTRGDGTNPYFEPSYKFGSETVLLVSEQRSDSTRRYAHGLAFMTFNANRQYETYSAGQRWATSDLYTYGVGFFRDGRMHGPWAINWPEPAKQGQTNKLQYICEYQNSKANGECRWFDQDGYFERREFYKDGQREGTLTRWTDEFDEQTEYVAGIEYGLFRKWNAAGELIERAQIYDNKKYGRSEFWYPGSEYPYMVRYFNFGPNTGWATFYDKEGRLGYQSWVEEGAFTGPYVEYFPSGAVHWEGARQNGQNYGVFKQYNAEGWVEFNIEYKNNVRDGVFRKYYKSGALAWEGRYVSGLREGTFTEYREDGKVAGITNYQADKLHGEYIRYDADNNIITHDIYENGEWVRSELAPAWPAPAEVTDENGKPVKRTYGRWRVETQDEMPSQESGMAMAWHEKLGGCVMFGGRGENAGVVSETWLRKDGVWQRVFADGAAPPAREAAAMAFDSRRGVIVLFGGLGSSGKALDDTWELSADGWRQVSPATRPGARAGASLVFDTSRGVCVLVGGQTADDFGLEEIRSDCWQWNGQEWTSTGTGPAVHGAAAAFDEQRGAMVVNGGMASGGASSGTWVHDGKRWQQRALWGAEAQSGHALVYDPDARGVLLLGAAAGVEPRSLRPMLAVYTEWSSYWNALRTCGVISPRRDFTAAYDRARREVVVFGGRFESDGQRGVFRETLTLADETAADRAANLEEYISEKLSAPGWSFIDNGDFASNDRSGWALVHDSKRGVTVMFGGWNTAGYVAETREFKDGKWNLRTPADSPAARAYAASWFDEQRGTVMLYGGNGPDGKLFDDLWEWDGENWRRLREHVPGAPASFSSWAYDLKRGVLVVLSEKDETWVLYEFNGTSWKDTGVTEPSGVDPGMLTYDPIKQQVLCAYPIDMDTFELLPKAWHWDGKYWAEFKPLTDGGEEGLGFRLYGDIAGKALWQVTDSAIRRFDGKTWQAWKRPQGLDPWAGRMWFDAAGKLHFHGTSKGWGLSRNDTLTFDPEQGEKIE